MSIIGMCVDTLRVGGLAHEERKCFGESGAVRDGSVGTDTGVGEGDLAKRLVGPDCSK